MARMILVTGGCRSGKSDFARKLAERAEGPRVFVATSPVIDEETRQRIRRHREARERGRWTTIEEPVDLARVILGAEDFNLLLVDCLTLWVNNLMYEAEKEGRRLDEDDIARQCRELLDASARFQGTAIFVTNEVGMGVVPENPTARLFRDLVGRCNQVMAGDADEVILVTCGLPLTLKKME